MCWIWPERPRACFRPFTARQHPRAGTLPSAARALGLPETMQVVIAGHDDIVAAYGAGAQAGDLID